MVYRLVSEHFALPELFLTVGVRNEGHFCAAEAPAGMKQQKVDRVDAEADANQHRASASFPISATSSRSISGAMITVIKMKREFIQMLPAASLRGSASLTSSSSFSLSLPSAAKSGV